MCLQEDVLCVLSKDKMKTGHHATLEVMQFSKHSAPERLVIEALKQLVEKGDAREYTEDGRRDGVGAQYRLLCTPTNYHTFRLTRIGADKRKVLMSRRRLDELKMTRRRTE